MGWAVDAIQKPFRLKDRGVVPVVLDDKWASGPVWTSVGKRKSLCLIEVQTPNHPTHSKSLYKLQ